MLEITESLKDMLKFQVVEACKLLIKDKEVLHIRKKAFDQLLLDEKETVQVHILVTRDQSDFLDDFQTEEMNQFQSTFTK